MASVLYDHAGPKTVARHRTYSIATVAFLVLLALLVVWRMYSEGEFAYRKWEPFVTPSFIQALIVDGLVKTIQLAVLSISFAVVFGLVFGVGKLSDRAALRWICWAVVEFFRAMPVLLLMVLIFFQFGTGGGIGSYWSVVIALTLYNGAVLAEVFRAGINAVPKGQSEAAYALGMRKSQVMREILLPQAVKIMLPAIISQMVVALKDTSLGVYVLAPGLSAVGKRIYSDTQFQNQLQTAIVLATLYILVNLLLTYLATLVQRKFVGEKAQLDVGQGAA